MMSKGRLEFLDQARRVDMIDYWPIRLIIFIVGNRATPLLAETPDQA